MKDNYFLFSNSTFLVQSLLPSPTRVSTISLEEVVQHFYKTSPTKGKLELLGIKEEPAKQVEEVSSEESSVEEVEIVQEEYLADPVQGSSSDSTGKIILARSQYFFSFFIICRRLHF